MGKRGLFITLEGIDGSGKSTHLPAVVSWLRGKGLKVTPTKEPGATEVGKAVRRLLLRRGAQLSDFAELLLYLAARAEHTASLVIPHLARKETVVSERYADSSLAYQGYGRGLDLNTIRQLNEKACQGLTPDLTILLDLDPEQAIRRLSGTRPPDRLESLGLDFHQRVRKGYLELAGNEPERIKVVDASDSRREVRREILRILEAAITRQPGKVGASHKGTRKGAAK